MIKIRKKLAPILFKQPIVLGKLIEFDMD